MGFLSKIVTAQKIWRESGISGIRRRLAWNKLQAAERNSYSKWLEKHGRLSDVQRKELTMRIGQFTRRPLISIILPVYNVDEKWLRLCIESVLFQIYPHWELCIADDCSPAPHVRRVLEEYAAADARIRVIFRRENGHISAASNSALELATGEFCVLLDHDDELAQDALFHVAAEILQHPEAALIYSDEDMIDEDGNRFSPKFKPDFSRDLLYSLNLVTHLSAYRTDILKEVGGFRVGLEGSQDYDLALRVIETIDERQIRHIPRILYHWRAIAGSVALDSNEKPYAHERARDAIRSHFERLKIEADVTATASNLHRVRYRLPAELPSATVILFGVENADVIERYKSHTAYPNSAFLVTDSDAPSDSGVLTDALARLLNRSAATADSDVLVFANANFSPADGSWLEELISFAIQNEIGVVGGALSTSDGTVVDGGLILGGDYVVSPAFEGFPETAPGNIQRNAMIGNFSAVSASCLAIRRQMFEELGGFNSGDFPQALFDADLCLRVRGKGLRIVFTPFARLRSFSKTTRRPMPFLKEMEAFRRRWGDVVKDDPFYNRNLSKYRGRFSINV